MAENFRAERAAFAAIEKSARQGRARALEVVRATEAQRETTPPTVAVGLGRRAWNLSRRRLDALRRLRGG